MWFKWKIQKIMQQTKKEALIGLYMCIQKHNWILYLIKLTDNSLGAGENELFMYKWTNEL